MKIVLIGAGSAQFGYGTVGEIFTSEIFAGAEVALVDINAEALAQVKSTVDVYLSDHPELDFTVTATTDRTEALSGASFVIISIEVGSRFELWDMDWKVPMEYGISQVYGENGGPGGVFHALRIIPPILDICEDVSRLCPEAAVISYSNPMSAIVTTVKRKYPELNFIGMCHEIASLERYVPDILETPFENLTLRAAGLNHFSVLVSASYRDSGRDAYPDIMEKAPAFFAREPGYSELWDYYQETGEIIETEGVRERRQLEGRKVRPWSDRRLFRTILETYKLLPITTDSHLGEYISWARDVADLRGILDFYKHYQKTLESRTIADISEERRERVVWVMESLYADLGIEEPAVNILNDGYIPDFPKSVAVEVPAVLDSRGECTVSVLKTIPGASGALIRNYAGVYDLTADAILEGSRDLLIQALMASPTVHEISRLPEMVDAMLSNQRAWLSYIR